MINRKRVFSTLKLVCALLGTLCCAQLTEPFHVPLARTHRSAAKPIRFKAVQSELLAKSKTAESPNEESSKDDEGNRMENDDSSNSDELPSIEANVEQSELEDDKFLGYAIDSFLRGDYDRPFANDAAAPSSDLSPGATVDQALRALRQLDEPEPSHGAAVFLRFCLPLSRGERWGDTSTMGREPWKEVLRGSLTPSMFARRIRASDFSELLDWSSLDVTEGAYSTEELVGVQNIAFVNAALYFGADGAEPSLIQFTLRRKAGVWLIDTARLTPKELFIAKS